MGRHIPQIQHNIRPRRAWAGILLLLALHARIRSPSKGVVFVLSNADYGRGAECVFVVSGEY